MNSDSEGNHSYDIPANDGGLGFRIGDSSSIKPSHLLGNNNYSSGDDDENQNNNSSDDGDDDDDDGNKNFSYGAYAARKRRKRERQSKSTDKERALYGVFYQDSSDDEGGGTRGRSSRQRTTTTGNSRQRGRHFDKRQNRMAGLAFVKGSSNNDAVTAGDDAGEDDAKDKVMDDGRRSKDGASVDKSKLEREGKKKKQKPIPELGWLKEKPRANKKASSPSRENKAIDTGDANANGETTNVDSDDMDIENDETANADTNNEEEMKLIHERQNRFEELLVSARTSTTKQNNKYRERQKQQQQQQQQSAVSDSNDGIGSRGIGSKNGNQKGEGRSGFVTDDIESKPSISEAISGGGIGLGASANSGIGLGYRSHATPLERETESTPQTTQGLGMGSTIGIGTPGLGAAGGRGLGMGSSAGMGIGSTPGTGGLGLGMSAGMGFSPSQDNFPSFSPSGTMMGGLGLGNEVPQKKKKKDPNLGKWEKHTKGIGMKLLQKMGYEGSGGLGAKRKQKDSHRETNETTVRDDRSDPPTAAPVQEEVSLKKGISRPVEVVVRPNGLGLGFGNFKEQSQLKVNRQIEAEVRGLKLPEEEQPKVGKKGKGIYDGIDESLLPSTESLLSGANGWRRGNKKKAKRKIISYRDILDKGAADGDGPKKLKIIDMRGTSTLPKGGTTTIDSTTAVLIGEELLHNVTLLLNTHEGQLRTSSYMVENAERKVASLESECKEIDERKEGAKRRSDKMKLALDVVEEAELLVEKMTTMEKDRNVSENGRLDFATDSLQRIFTNLYSNFSREDRISLKFDATLIPSIATPLLDSLTSTLNPLRMGDYTSWMNRLAVGIQKLCATTGSDNEAYALREIILTQSIAPWITRSLSSTKWDPVANVETGLGIYEALLNCACKSFPEAESEENDILKDTITNEIVNNAVLPKLLRAVSHWRPEMDRARQRIANPLHLWILPWLPYIADDATLGTLLTDVRRNSKKTLSFLGKSVSDDAAFVRACISVLDPWKRLLGESAIFELTSDLVAPRVARSLARVEVRILPADQDWEQLNVLFDYFKKGLMSGDDFVSLVEGEVLPAWSYALHCALKRKDRGDMHDFKGFYIAWKGQFFDLSANARGKILNPQVILRSDPMVCRYFFGGLKMIEAAHVSNETMLDDLRPTHPADCNYRISLMHRSKVRQPQDNEESSDVNVRVRRRVHENGNTGVAATFQEVVESFANQHDITFHPKSGSNSKRDGKPVFMFGDHPVYFDKNVLFAKRGSAWRPISLEHLAQSC